MSAAEGTGGPPLLSTRFEGRIAFRQHVRDVLANAAREGARHLFFCDPDFEDWPLDEQSVAEDLHAWARSGRQARLLACRWDTVQRHHARFVEWRRVWSHLVEARACPRADRLAFPSVLATTGVSLERHDCARSVGWAGPGRLQPEPLPEALQAWWQRATPAFPATTLGL